MKKFVVLVLTMIVSIVIYSQETPISNTTWNTCQGFLVDTGMSAGDYGNNENFTMTICSDTDTIINLFFNLYAAGAGDTLSIYDGSDTDAPFIGSFTDYSLSQQNITSSNPEGCLTLVWSTDGADIGNFTAEVSCEAPCIPPFVDVTVNGDTAYTIYACPGSEVSFDASGTTFNDGTLLSSFEWNFYDGTDVDSTSWPIASHIFENPGGYLISLTVIDDNDCQSTNVIDLLVLVSTYPIWDPAISIEHCVGEGEIIFEQTGEDGVDLQISQELFDYNVEAVPFTFNFGGLDGGYLFIPDDQTTCFESTVTVQGFSPGATIEEVGLLENLFINFEHSFMGDLTITFICPNNQSIAVHQQGGGGTNLGTPDQGDGTGPGEGFDYWWSPNAEAGTWADEGANYAVLPSGTYSSAQDFSSLIGCPVNGIWTVQICDSWGSDDGYIFDWHIEFDSTLFPSFVGTSPIYGMNCDSTYFNSDYFTQNDDCTLDWNQPILESGEIPVIVTTTNNFGCTFNDTISFMVYDDPIADAGLDQQICELDAIVQLSGSSSGETSALGDYHYEWTPSVFLSDSLSFTPTLDDNAQGDLWYYLTVSPIDHPLCASIDSVHIVIAPTPQPVIVPDGGTIICSNGEIGLSVEDNYSGYEWNNDISLNTNTVTVPPGTHIVTVYYDPNCPVSDTIVITALPTADFLDNSLCQLEYFINDNDENIPGSWSYTTSDGGELEFNSDGSNTFVTATAMGNYQLTFTDNCGLSDDFNINMLLPPTEEQFTIPLYFQPCDDEAPLLLQPSGSDFNFYSWEWSNGSTEPNTGVVESGVYTYMVSNACGSNEDTTTVEFISCNLIIPNIFTPDQRDTLNNYFVIDGLHFFPGSHLAVYNRWGNIVYESQDYKNNWSPTKDNVADGTYYYVLNVARSNGSTDDYAGYVAIIRDPK